MDLNFFSEYKSYKHVSPIGLGENRITNHFSGPEGRYVCSDVKKK
jgi:hypothetical protein